jgi:hydroxymethylbilane synthase
MASPLRLGTRGSPLALWQANMVADALCTAHDWPRAHIEIVQIRTTGDKVQDRALAEIGGKALWTKELDRALLDGDIDFAVHSMKDVETIRPAAIVIAAMPPRADTRDRLIGADSLAALPANARVGTSSPRRAAQVRRARPDAQILLFRGNVDTRLRKLAEGEADATLLAAAGLDRLGRGDIGAPLDLLPAPSQGAVGIEARADDAATRALLAAIDHDATSVCVLAERALLAALGADCRSPVAALARIDGTEIHLRAELLSEDGGSCEAGEIRFARGDDTAPARLATTLLDRAAPSIRALFAT